MVAVRAVPGVAALQNFVPVVKTDGRIYMHFWEHNEAEMAQLAGMREWIDRMEKKVW